MYRHTSNKKPWAVLLPGEILEIIYISICLLNNYLELDILTGKFLFHEILTGKFLYSKQKYIHTDAIKTVKQGDLYDRFDNYV